MSPTHDQHKNLLILTLKGIDPNNFLLRGNSQKMGTSSLRRVLF